MSGPPPPPPPPLLGPPPIMEPPSLPKSEHQSRSALLTDITKGTKLKSAKHLMNDRSGLQSCNGGNHGIGGSIGGTGNRPVISSGCENGRISSGRSTTGRLQPARSGTAAVRNPPQGLGDLFGGGVPTRKGLSSHTIGRSAGDRVSNGSVDNFSAPFSGKPDCGNITVGRSGSRISGLSLSPSPSNTSRPLPNVPPLSPLPSLPNHPPPPPTRTLPPAKDSGSNENGTTRGQGYNTNRMLPPSLVLPPKPPERKESIPPPPPPTRAYNGPPPHPIRAPPINDPPSLHAISGKGNVSRSLPPPPVRGGNAPPPPPPPQTMRLMMSRTNSIATSTSEFEAMFQFPTDLPNPEPFMPSPKTYPSQTQNRKGSVNAGRRPVPPPPPPGSS